LRSRFLVAALALFAFAVPMHAYRMTAWVPSWDPKALEIMQMHAGYLQETNPGWYTVAADGSVTANYKADDPTMRAALTGTQLVPTIKNYVNGRFDGALVASLLSTPNSREEHADALTQLVVTRGFDGIDIDYESLPATARDNFSTFISVLATKLHASNRVLSVTVHAKTSDSATSSGKGAQDWRAIGAVADSVKIMGYDKHWDGSAAGAIAPLDWLGQVAAYAESTIPAGKAILGLPWYGYDWLGTDATTVTYAGAMALAQQQGATIGRDASGEATFTYAGRTVFFQDAAAYRAKVEAITKNHPGIAGFAAWRVGSEDPNIWPIVRELTLQAAAIRPAPESFLIEGPKSLDVVAGETATAMFGYTAINGFSGDIAATVRIIDAFGGTAAFSTPILGKLAGTRLVVSAPKTAREGSYQLVVTMTGKGITQTQSVRVNVTAAPSSSRRRSVR
jgi:spore germination protein YaaH